MAGQNKRVVIEIPNDRVQEVAEAISKTYGQEPTVGGIRQHLIEHLKQTVSNQARERAARESVPDFKGNTWGDLNDPEPEEPETDE